MPSAPLVGSVSPVAIPAAFGCFRDFSWLASSKRSNVYKATDVRTGRPVVVKMVIPGADDIRGPARLRNEHRVLSKVTSRAVPSAIECGTFRDGYYLARDYFEGDSLASYLRLFRLSVVEFLQVAGQIVEALGDVHASGVIHKNLDPTNILYDGETRTVALIDFALGSEFSRERSIPTDARLPEGRVWYVAPEQTGRMNHTVDFRADFYALGVSFFEMLCGRRPFEAESEQRIIHMHLATPPPLVRSVNPNVPDALSRIVGKLMAKMPEDRYRTSDGLLLDLRRCRQALESGAEADLELGVADHPQELDVPQRTFGRDEDIAALEGALMRARRGAKQLIVVAGHAGVGKTTLVGELQRRLAGTDDVILQGKYDQFRGNLPYAAISKALERFCDFVLSESDASVEAWRARIAPALRRDGRLLVDRIPRLALLAGEMESLPELTTLEERTRFRAALQELLGAIASPGRALVLYFDDLHLADAGSFDLVEEIVWNERLVGLVLVACYRDNEVDDEHPLSLSLARIRARGANVRQLTLAGLSPIAVTSMIAATLRSEASSVGELAAVVYGKTHGNPFYIRQFLSHCHRQGHLRFDHGARAWRWDLAAIRRCQAEENVVDFLVRNLEQLAPETTRLLSVGACVGATFGLDTLARISGMEPESIRQALRRAVELEIVYSTGGEAGATGDAELQFSHDRFQQALYTVLSARERSEIHAKLAAHYEALGHAEAELAEKRFLLADSYSKAFGALPDDAHRRRASEVLLQTAKAAGARSAFNMAIRYLELVIDWLRVIGDEDDFAFAVHAEYHSALCGAARWSQADAVYARLQVLAKAPLALTDSCCLQAIGLSNRGRYKDAFTLGVGLLGELGVPFPTEDLQAAVRTELGALYAKLGGGSFPGVERLPRSESLVESSIAKLLNRISTAGFFYNAFGAFWAILTNAERVLANGYTRDGLPLYGSLTLVLIPFRNDYRLSYDLARGAMRLAEANGYRIHRMYHLYSLVNSHWYEDWKAGLSYAREAHRGNTASGDFEFACYSYFTTEQIVLETCTSLDDLADETRAALAFAERHGNVHAQQSFVVFQRLCRALTGSGELRGAFEDEDFSESAHLASIAANPMALCFYYTLRALSAVVYADFPRAFEATEMAIPYLPSVTGFHLTALHRFLHSLSICRRVETGACATEERAVLLGKLAANQKWLGERAADAPMNFTHLYDLVEAERAAIVGEQRELVSLYERAIAGARANGRPYHYALSCDLAGQRLFGSKAPMTAASFLHEAQQAYGAWGASGKTAQMRREPPGQRLPDLAETRGLSLRPRAGATKPFDLSSLLLASQALSKETEVEAVLSSLMSVLLENAGAQDIYYLIERGGALAVMAESHVGGNAVVFREPQPPVAEAIAWKVVNFVARARRPIILDNAATSDAYGADEHIAKRGCKSVMCVPVVSKAALKGLLYLENNLIEGAFDEQRIDALNAIAAQLAISLENAYLIDNLHQLVDDRTRELRAEITIRREAEAQKETVIADLRRALEKVKLLSGLLPICAGCKKIRDDKGYWNQIEGYIRAHSEAEFSHGICPECFVRLYPDMADIAQDP